jgi:hypothetical protein
MGFVSDSFGLSSRRFAAMPGEHDRFDERSEANRGSLARGARANVVGCRPRRREGANRFDGLQFAARWDRREARLLVGSSWCAHEVSHQNGGLLDRGHWPPRGRSVMTLITPLHSRQDGGSGSTVSLGADVGDSIFPRIVGSPPSVRSERQRASFCVRWPLARNPKWRMR